VKITMEVPGAGHPGKTRAWLRLYVAGGTPNSARAQENLKAALAEMDGQGAALDVQIVDVFKSAKRALADGVIVTPTLIGGGPADRVVMMGDLSEGHKLTLMLRSLTAGI
jgi:hypothetical protein